MKRPLIVTVVGARPQFIKAAPVSRALRIRAREILVHTGQHYDDAMSGSFFRDLGLPKPGTNLGVGSGSHAAKTGRMMEGIEKVLIKEKPDWVLVYGDTNSTLAGALAAAKLHIPIAHVEAGLRSFNRRMPEEINRILTDHLSSLLFCPTAQALSHLRAEGIRKGLVRTGDVMREALFDGLARARRNSSLLKRLQIREGAYDLATVHRAENTDDPERLAGILGAFKKLARNRPLIWPLHPRTRARLGPRLLAELSSKGIRVLPPAGYLDMIRLESAARLILTDSGGVQKEAFWLGVPCLTLRDETEWGETLKGRRNQIAGTSTARILSLAARIPGRRPPSRQGVPASTLIARTLVS